MRGRKYLPAAKKQNL